MDGAGEEAKGLSLGRHSTSLPTEAIVSPDGLSEVDAKAPQVTSLPVVSIPLTPPQEMTESYAAFHSEQMWILRNSGNRTPIRTSTTWAPLANGPPPPLNTLTPTTLKDLACAINSIHHGFVIFLKVVEFPAFSTSGLHMLVEDSNGDRIHLIVHNCLPKGESAQGFLPLNSRIALLEPYIKNSRDVITGRPMLRCDNPQCFVRFRNVAEWQAAAAGKAANPNLGDLRKCTAAQLRERGNVLFKHGRYFAAAEVYSDALHLLKVKANSNPEEALKAYGNRAECYLRLGRWFAAEEDAVAVLKLEPANVKAKCRQVRALLGQDRPRDALTLIEELHASIPEDPAVASLRAEALIAVREHEEGIYDFHQICIEATAHSCLASFHANYKSPDIETVEYPGKGRGVRAKKDLYENQLILANRAFAFLPGAETESEDRETGVGNSFLPRDAIFPVLTETIQQLLLNPPLATTLYDLYAGPKFEGVPPPDSPSAIVDVDRIRSILFFNGFDACRDEWMEVVNGWQHREMGKKAQEAWLKKVQEINRNTGCGLWVRDAYLNNSCAPNCLYFQIADFHFTFVSRPVAAGEELCLHYYPCETSPVDREYFFTQFGEGEGFVCGCSRCTYLSAHPMLRSIEEECFNSHREACELAAEKNLPMALAADVMPPKRRQQLKGVLSNVPLEHRSALTYVLVLEGAALQWDGNHELALSYYQEAAAIRYAVRGGSSHFQRFIDLCLVAGTALACQDEQLALETLRLAYQTCCVPFERSAESFQYLALTYCTPRWKDVAKMEASQAEALHEKQVELLKKAVCIS